jgi:ketosteroid isomerase-like protein
MGDFCMAFNSAPTTAEAAIRKYFSVVDQNAIPELLDCFSDDVIYERPGYPVIFGFITTWSHETLFHFTAMLGVNAEINFANESLLRIRPERGPNLSSAHNPLFSR